MSERIRTTVAAVLAVPPETLSDVSSPATVKSWDSLNHLNLMLALESEFDVTFSLEDMVQMRDLRNIKATLLKYGVLL